MHEGAPPAHIRSSRAESLETQKASRTARKKEASWRAAGAWRLRSLRTPSLQLKTEGREQPQTDTNFWRTRRGAEFAPRTPPRGQTDIATRSGHPLRGNDSNPRAVCARQSP